MLELARAIAAADNSNSTLRIAGQIDVQPGHVMRWSETTSLNSFLIKVLTARMALRTCRDGARALKGRGGSSNANYLSVSRLALVSQLGKPIALQRGAPPRGPDAAWATCERIPSRGLGVALGTPTKLEVLR